jgi:hypothetical protein
MRTKGVRATGEDIHSQGTSAKLFTNKNKVNDKLGLT